MTIKGKTWLCGTNSCLSFDVSVMLNLSIAFPLTRTGMMMKWVLIPRQWKMILRIVLLMRTSILMLLLKKQM